MSTSTQPGAPKAPQDKSLDKTRVAKLCAHFEANALPRIIEEAAQRARQRVDSGGPETQVKGDAGQA